MNKINNLVEKKKNILSIYFTAGFPRLNDTVTVLEELVANGADLIEIGIPFSDPLADGPVIQHSSTAALENGMNMKLLFEQLEGFNQKNESSDVPLILMGYLNPVLQFGMERFCEKASVCGIDGIILPDLPLQEYTAHYQPVFEKYNLCPIFLITPQTSEQRIRLIDTCSKGFIYMVSSASTTGTKGSISEEQLDYFKRVNSYGLKNPTLTGFGISNRETFSAACQYSAGAIIGSAFIKTLAESKDLRKSIKEFVSSIRTSVPTPLPI